MKHPAEDRKRAFFALLALGVLASLSELLLLREALFLAGGTELAAGVFLAAWLLAGAAGALAGAKWSLGRALGWLLAACAAVLPAQILLLRILRGLLSGSSGELPPVFDILLAGALAAMPLPFILGALFPAAAGYLGRAGAARAYVIETVGLALGAGLVLPLGMLRSEYVAVAVACILFTVGGALAGRRRRMLIGALGLLPLVLAASGLWERAERATTAYAFGFPGVESVVSTPQGRALSARHAGELHVYSGGLTETSPASANESLRLALSVSEEARRVLIICEDPAPYAGAMGAFPGVECIVLAPDQGMLEFRRKARPFIEPANVMVFAREPLEHLREADKPVDLLLLAAGAPVTAQNNRLFTLGFFRLVKSRLSRGGVLAVELPYSPGHVSADRTALAGSVSRTLSEVFEGCKVALTQYGGSILLLASPDSGVTDTQPQPSAGNAASVFPPVDYDYSFNSYRTRQASRALREGAWRLNTVTEPACYQHAVSLSQRRFGPPEVLEWVWELRFNSWLVLLGAVGAVFLVLVMARGGQFGPYSCALGGGFCAMVSQVMVIYLFQSAHGVLYSHIGLVAAAFMLGALGGSRLCRERRAPLLAFCILIVLSLFAGALPCLLGAFEAAGLMFSRYFVFPAASAAAGALIGALFPSCSNLVPDKSGGRVYAADLAGASGGALVAGLVLIPSLNLHTTALLTAFAGLFLAFPLLAAIMTGRLPIQSGS